MNTNCVANKKSLLIFGNKENVKQDVYILIFSFKTVMLKDKITIYII